jgi:hypothetical protein
MCKQPFWACQRKSRALRLRLTWPPIAASHPCRCNRIIQILSAIDYRFWGRILVRCCPVSSQLMSYSSRRRRRCSHSYSQLARSFSFVESGGGPRCSFLLALLDFSSCTSATQSRHTRSPATRLLRPRFCAGGASWGTSQELRRFFFLSDFWRSHFGLPVHLTRRSSEPLAALRQG